MQPTRPRKPSIISDIRLRQPPVPLRHPSPSSTFTIINRLSAVVPPSLLSSFFSAFSLPSSFSSSSSSSFSYPSSLFLLLLLTPLPPPSSPSSSLSVFLTSPPAFSALPPPSAAPLGTQSLSDWRVTVECPQDPDASSFIFSFF